MRPEAKVLADASRRRGVIVRAEALEAQMTPAEIRSRLETGRWLRREPGIYVVAGTPDTPEQRLHVALLGTGAVAVASCLTAGRLFGITRVEAEVLDVLVPHGSHHRDGPGRIVHQARNVTARDVTTIGEFRVTTPNRTIIDLAGVLRPYDLEAALDEAVMRKLVTLDGLERYIRGRRFKGAKVLRRLLRDRKDGVPQEEMERTFDRNVIKRFKLPKPKRQWPFAGNKRIDFAYPDLKIAIELDSWRWHGSLLAFRADRPRQNILELDGWMVLRFTWDAVRYRPQEVSDTILTALGRRGSAPASRIRVSRSRGSG